MQYDLWYMHEVVRSLNSKITLNMETIHFLQVLFSMETTKKMFNK